MAKEYLQIKREEKEILANASIRGASRRLKQFGDLDGTHYCGGGKAGPGVPTSAVDRCCAFHDYACASNYPHETGSYGGASDSAKPSDRFPTGLYNGKPEHCGCAVA